MINKLKLNLIDISRSGFLGAITETELDRISGGDY